MVPPTMAAISPPDPLPVNLPKPAIPRVKMLGKSIVLKSPTARMAHMATLPVVRIEVVTNRLAAIASGVNRAQEGCGKESSHHGAHPKDCSLPTWSSSVQGEWRSAGLGPVAEW
jgi:hypothetical protein